MANQLDIARDVSMRLERAGIEYMLIGSMAMNYYAQPRMTRDIDLVVALTSRDADRLARFFAPDYYVVRDAISAAVDRESLFNLIHLVASSKSIVSSARPPRIVG